MFPRRLLLVTGSLFWIVANTAMGELADDQIGKIRAGQEVSQAEFRKAYDETLQNYRTARTAYYLGQVKWSLIDHKRQGGWPYRSDLLMESPDTIYNGLKKVVEETGDPVARYAFIFPSVYKHEDRVAAEQLAFLRDHDDFLYQRAVAALPIARNMLAALKQKAERIKAEKKEEVPVEQPTPKPERKGMLEVKRWPVQIVSATYGTAGKDADVTGKVKEFVEDLQKPFASNPKDLGADPNPGWNKSLRIVYMKDGVRREQRRNENEDILPESFYGPHDAAELKAWLPASRWVGEAGELQFHADGSCTSPGQKDAMRWDALGPKKIRIAWPDSRTVEFDFDYTWSSFSEVANGKNVWHVLR
jgi:hypothetical protein